MRRPWDSSKGFDLSAPCGLLVPVGERGLPKIIRKRKKIKKMFSKVTCARVV